MAEARTLPSFLSRLAFWRRGASSAQNATLANLDPWLTEILSGIATATGQHVTPLKALGVATVFACVNVRARSVSSIPLKLYRNLPGGGREVARDHYLYSLLHDAPNDEMTSVDFRRAIQANAVLRNNGYALIVRNGLGEIAELRPIDNADIKPERRSIDGELGYRLKGEWLPADRIFHVRGLTFNGVTGFDPTGSLREVIGLAMALQEHGARIFSNGASIGGFLETPISITPEQLIELRAEFDKKHTALRNAHRPMIGTPGMKWQSTAATNESSQFLESRRHQDIAICQAYGVPPHKVGISEGAKFSSVEDQNIDYVTDSVFPDIVQWEQTLNQRLLSREERREYSFGFVLEGLLRGNIKTRFEAYAIARNWGWMSPNEIRERENLNPIEGGDEYLSPLNMAPLGSAARNLPPAKSATESANT